MACLCRLLAYLMHSSTTSNKLFSLPSTECLATTFFYQNLCYDECPLHTYAQTISDELDVGVADVQIAGTITTSSPLDAGSNEPQFTGNGLIDKDDPLQAGERRRRDSPLHNRVCADCDASCLRCYGPNINQCSTCPPGSQLRKLPESNETYCYAYVVRSTVDDSNGTNGQQNQGGVMQYMHWSTALFVIAVNLSVIGIVIVAAMMYHRRTTREELYTRVALIADDDSDEDHEVNIFTARHPPSKDVIEYHDEVRPPSEALEVAGSAAIALEADDEEREHLVAPSPNQS